MSYPQGQNPKVLGRSLVGNAGGHLGGQEGPNKAKDDPTTAT
jgi:hypothetical protein